MSENANLTVTGQPVITTDTVYQAYIDALKNDPDLIKRAERPLQPGEYHLTHDFQGDTWYVPAHMAGSFFKLYLVTTVQRQTKVPVVLTIATTIVGTINITEIPPTESTLEIHLKDKILNDSGKLTTVVNGIEKNFRYQAIRDLPNGQPTDRVLLINDESDSHLNGNELAKAIAGKEATLKNDTFVPGFVSPIPNPLEPIRSQLELQRLQQFGR
jgi:hypothetical protein